MDFDLFDLDEDDDILSTIRLTPTQEELILSVPELQCNGEDSIKSNFLSEISVKNTFTDCILHKGIVKINFNQIYLSSAKYNYSELIHKPTANFVFGEVFMSIQSLVSMSKNTALSEDNSERSWYKERQVVTNLLYVLLKKNYNQQRFVFRQFVSRLRKLLNNIVNENVWRNICFAHSNKGNDCILPKYHLLHGALEWKMLDLCLLKMNNESITNGSSNINNNNNTFIKQLERVFYDILSCSLHLYKHSKDVLKTSPFPCTCFKEIWLFLQIGCEKWLHTHQISSISFWTILHKVIGDIKSKLDIFSISIIDFYIFSNWVINSLTRLFGYNIDGKYIGAKCTRANCDNTENSKFCETYTQQFLNEDPNENQLRLYISLLIPIVLEWWQPNADISMLLWEYFYKRLNSSFFAVDSPPNYLAVACTSGKAYLENYKLLLNNKPDIHQCSYTHFTHLLGNTLNRLFNAQMNNKSQKLLGRIFTKFSIQKCMALNETGIHHLIELFLVLALSGDLNELAPKLRDKLLSVSLEKLTTSKQISLIKGHVAFLLLFAENKIDMSDYISKLHVQLANINHNLEVIRILADALPDIFSYSESFQLGEHMLIDNWLQQFLTNGLPAQQDRTLSALHSLFSNLQIREKHFGEINNNFLKSLNTYVLPFVRQQYSTNFGTWMPQLAADFCIHATDVQTFHNLFNYFVESPNANHQALPQFLMRILDSHKSSLVDDVIIIHSWLKCLILLTHVNEDVSNLTKLVINLSTFKLVVNITEDELINANEQLSVVVSAIGKNFDSTTSFDTRYKISDRFNAFLRNFDKWLKTDIRLEKPELVFRFYSFLAIVIYNCPHMVYTKSKINCFFHVAITRFVLPTNIQMGKSPDPQIAKFIHKIWPVLVQGIGRLNFKSDQYINKTLTDLVLKWTPHFKISSQSKLVARPYITCLTTDTNELSLFILDKLMNTFLVTRRRQADINACLAVTILHEVVQVFVDNPSTYSNISCLKTFLNGTSFLILEHILMVDDVSPSRSLLLNLLKLLITSSTYKNSKELQDIIPEHLRQLTKKHLAYYTFFYFDLLMKLVDISYEIIEEIMNFLYTEILVVEQKRGAGEDNRIRECLKNLQKSIDKSKHNQSMMDF